MQVKVRPIVLVDIDNYFCALNFPIDEMDDSQCEDRSVQVLLLCKLLLCVDGPLLTSQF